MSIINNEDIRAYRDDTALVCPECITDKDLEAIREDDIITQIEVETKFEDQTAFCDRCQKKLW